MLYKLPVRPGSRAYVDGKFVPVSQDFEVTYVVRRPPWRGLTKAQWEELKAMPKPRIKGTLHLDSFQK